MFRFSVLLIAAMLSVRAADISLPLVGLANGVRFGGVAGNFLRLDEPSARAETSAFSGTAGAVKQERELVIVDSDARPRYSLPAPEGPALIGFTPSGEIGAIYFPASGELRRVGLPARPDGPGGPSYIALAVTADSIDLVQRRAGALWLERRAFADGEVLSLEPLGFEADLLLALPQGGWVSLAGNRLEIRGTDASVRHVDLPILVASLELMGRDWIAAGHFAIRVSTGDIYRLPQRSPAK